MNVAALRSAVRAAIVIPAVFALTDKVIAQPQVSLLAAFGSFAIVVFTEFAGTWRARLLAYASLGAVGALFITLGTLCSRTPWIGAVVMAAVGFATLFSGVLGGYFAAGATGAILTFVLPVTIPAANSVIPQRLEGWGIAVGAGICAVMLLWPTRTRADLARSVAETLRAVAGFIEGTAAGDGARAAVDALGRRLLGSQHRPTGPTAPTAALTSIPDELDWLLSFVRPPIEPTGPEDEEALAAAAGVLRASADRLEGKNVRPDFAALDIARDGVARAVVRRLPDVPDIESLEQPFRIRVATYSALVVGIGTHESVLWIVLPFAVLLASYAPRAISFAAGQAGFTVTLFILFNIIQPVGWRVGVVRVEDVAIGFAISLGVGLLFWPRGAAALLREQLADALPFRSRLGM